MLRRGRIVSFRHEVVAVGDGLFGKPRLVFSNPAGTQGKPPIADKDFLKALSALSEATRKLGQSKDPASGRAVVDQMERILGDARRALWKLEQAEKQKRIKTPIETPIKTPIKK